MAICVIVDTADNRVRGYCHGDAARNGEAIVCDAGSGCLAAPAGKTRRFYAGTKSEFEAAMIAGSTTVTAWHEMDGASYDGTSFGTLTLLPRS